MPVFSNSRLGTYEQCPLKYKYQYIDKIKVEEAKTVEAFMGSCVHETLEKLYRDLKLQKRNTQEDLLKFYNDLWAKNWSDDIKIVRKEYTADNYRKTGEKCIADYYNKYAPFKERVLGIETEEYVNLDPEGEFKWNVRMDRLDYAGDGKYEIHDYKTAGYLPKQEQADEDRQLALYSLWVKENFRDAENVELVWHYLAFDRELRLRRERSDLERIAAEAAATVRAIESCEDFPARESALCGWCELQAYCPKRKHPVMVMEMRERELGMERGAQLADQYAEWSRRKKEAEERLGELREEILEFSSYHAVDNIQGSSCMLKLSRGRAPKLPPDGCEQRDELERVLRQCGAWEDASRLDARRAASLLEREDIDREVRACLAALISWEETPTLRVSRRRE